MPKITKKKKEKQADFTKAKLKLGKGKKQASNATDTSFKARSIALPGQEVLSRAILQQEGAVLSEPTTANGLTLDDVFIRFRHPNAGVRRESIGGVKEILTMSLGRETGKTLRALGGLVSDDDASVRKALLGLLAWYIPQMPVPALSPHLPLLVLQTSSALSHIFPEIRLDACKLVHLLLLHVPNHVVGSWPHQTSNILEGLRLAVGLGGEKGVNSQIGRLTGGAKLVTLKAMTEFVRKGLGVQDRDQAQAQAQTQGDQTQNGNQDWLDGWIAKKSAVQAIEKTVRPEPSLEDLQPEGWLVGGSWDVNKEIDDAWELGRLEAQGLKEDEDGIVSVLSQLYIQLHPLLLSTFLESAPTAFSPSSTSTLLSSSASADDIPLALCTTTATLTELLARAILTRAPVNLSPEVKEVKTCVSDFLRRMAAWFPFHTSRSSAPTPSGLTPAFELSLVYANLAVLLAPRPVELNYHKELLGNGRKENGWRERTKAVEIAWNEMRERDRAKGKWKGKASGAADNWAMEEVAQWVVDTLSPKKDILAQTQNLTPIAYSSLFPIVFALLTRPPANSESEVDIPTMVGEAFLAHLTRQASTSTIRSLGDSFVITLIEIHETKFPMYPFFVPSSNTQLRKGFREWFESIPKVLWERGIRDERATGDLLRFLLRLGLRGSKALERPYSILDAQTFPTMASKLAPFFHLSHPAKGSIPGPWTKLTSAAVKKLGLDVVEVWSEWDADKRLRTAVGKVVKAV